MVSMLASSVVDREFESRSVQTKDYKIGICCFLSLEAQSIKEKEKRLVGAESRATCLSADCYFSKLAL